MTIKMRLSSMPLDLPGWSSQQGKEKKVHASAVNENLRKFVTSFKIRCMYELLSDSWFIGEDMENNQARKVLRSSSWETRFWSADLRV